MTGDGDETETPDTDSGAPVDFDRLDVITERLSTDDRFERIEAQPEFAPDRVICVYNTGFYPTPFERPSWKSFGSRTVTSRFTITKNTSTERSIIGGTDTHRTTTNVTTFILDLVHRRQASTLHTRRLA